MALIKDIYSPAFYTRLGLSVKKQLPSFNQQLFNQQIFTTAFKTMEWKERMNHTTIVLHNFLPVDFPEAVDLIKKIITQLRTDGYPNGGLEFIFFADYLPRYGLDDFKTSVDAIEFVTQFISCEFAVRPFLIRYGDRMYKQMLRWSKHKSPAVRRLSSEGIRPRLPWAIAVPDLKADPAPVLPILENLKQDPSESVRRSVANNLNDIAKDHPDIVLQIAFKWKGISPETDAIIKHGSRTLLKKGHSQILEFFGLDSKKLEAADFRVLTPRVQIGKELNFKFNVVNNNSRPVIIRLEYAIWYLKANGQLASKVFKITEKLFPGKSVTPVQRRQSFRVITTKVFYPGKHEVSVILNGAEKARGSFTLYI
ncbi:MAG: DNA alkylation repair protein [Chitinophagaceae bacterium]